MTEQLADLDEVKSVLGDEFIYTEETDPVRGRLVLAKPKKHFPRKEFQEKRRQVEDLGGEYLYGQGLFEIPLAKEAPAIKNDVAHEKLQTNMENLRDAGQSPVSPFEAVEEPTEEEAQFLEPTYKMLGPLDPVKLDAHGNVIDGLHRRAIDEKWPTMKLKHITDPVQTAIARLVINVCRRKVPPEEKTKLLANIAKLTKWTPKQIAKNTGMSYRWVLKYLPEEYKQPEPKQFASARHALQEESSEVKAIGEPGKYVLPKGTVFVQCSNCAVGTMYPAYWHGEPVCPRCYEKLSKPIEKAKAPRAKPAEVQSRSPTEPTEIKRKPVDTGSLFECPECHDKFLIIHTGLGVKGHKFKQPKAVN